MILAEEDNEEPVSFLTLQWIEQNVNTCTNQSEVRRKVDKLRFEVEAQELIKEMQANKMIAGLHYVPHKLDEQREYARYLNDKDK